MHIGLSMFATDYAIPPHELARAAEERGFESLWLPEHTHIPASRKTPYPAGTELPKEYWHTLDPFGALCAAAAVTRTIKLATGICLVIERDTIVTAKEVATVDQLSGGRFIFGIGGGWNREEMEHHGTKFETRFARMKEQIAAMRAIWTQEEPEFHGRFVNFSKIWCHPKPVQKPGPQVVIGGVTKHAIKRVVDYGDGWLPLDVGAGPERMRRLLDELARQAEQKKRDPKSISVSIFGAAPRPETIAAYRELGVDRVVINLRPLPSDEVLPRLDKHVRLLS